jgi:hypothetical protein
VKTRTLIAMICLAVVPFLAAPAAFGQAAAGQAPPGPVFEVQESSGFVEALLPDLGWRQAVIGRQLPAGSVVTSWIDARATLSYGDSVLTLEPFTHLGFAAIGNDVVRLTLLAGGVKVKTAALACELEYKGMVVRIENGTATISDATVSVQEGTVTVTGAQDKPLIVAAGSSIGLTARREGPVFSAADPWAASSGK